MRYVEASLGISTADAEQVTLQFDGSRLSLSFVDWQEKQRVLVFGQVLAFRWQEFDEAGIRNDVSYEVVESEWLARQAQLQAVNPELYAHYKLCFNAAGTLDVVAIKGDGATPSGGK
jgi:hypothetical protein